MDVRDPQAYPHAHFAMKVLGWFMPPRLHWKRGLRRYLPFSWSEQLHRSFALCQLLWVPLTCLTHVHRHVGKRETQYITGINSQLIGVISALFGRVSMLHLGVHLQTKRPLGHIHAKVAQKWLWAGTQYRDSKTAPPHKKSLTRQSWVDSCRDFVRRKDLSFYYRQDKVYCFLQACKTLRLLKL